MPLSFVYNDSRALIADYWTFHGAICEMRRARSQLADIAVVDKVYETVAVTLKDILQLPPCFRSIPGHPNCARAIAMCLYMRCGISTRSSRARDFAAETFSAYILPQDIRFTFTYCDQCFGYVLQNHQQEQRL